MIIGILKEKYTGEKRVPLTPDSVKKIIDLGYEICFETNCGFDSNFQNQDYIDAGAILKENYKNEKFPNSKGIYNKGFYIPCGNGIKMSEAKTVVKELKKILNDF